MKGIRKKDTTTGKEYIGSVKAGEIAPDVRPFRHNLTVEFNGQTMFELPAQILALLATSAARESAKLYINNALYLSPADWTITSTFLQFTNEDFVLKTEYALTLLR